ncbi:MAG: histidine kinase, partial [Saprospiraceae bacterium]|nr:histidine kinase [Saprospiraceae bacterium]
YLPGKKTTSMFEDKQGNYWFCTMDDGIYCLPASAPAILDKRSGLPSNSVTSVSLGKNDQIYAGDDEGNFSEIKKGVRVLGKIKSTDGYNRILDILDSGEDKTWIATDEGLYLKNKNSLKKTRSTSAAPKAIVLEDEKVWCGTSSRLYLTSSKTCDTISSFQFVQRVTALAKDKDGNLWAGGIEGLYCSSDSFKHNWGQDFANLKTRIVSIKIDERNRMWVATPDSGLVCGVLEKGILKKTITINKLLQSPIRNIQSIFIENPESIWLATNNGIHALNTQNWSVRHLDHFDGLANDDVRSLVVRNDSLWAATSAGVSLFALKPNYPITSFPAYITMLRYRVDENTVAFDLLDSLPAGKNEIVLPSNAALIEISFAGLDYRRKGTPYFECETMEALLPFKWWTKENLTNWLLNKFVEKKQVTKIFKNYLDFGVNLTPGRYHIQIVAIGSDGQQRSLPDNCFFILPPKWYQTIWISLLIWFAIAYAIFKLYQANVKLREMAIAVAQSRLVALQAQINPHFIGNTVNAVQRFFYPPNPVGSSTYTATFTRLLRRTLNFSEQSFIPFEEEISYNIDYMELAKQRLGDDKFCYEIIGDDAIPSRLPFPALFLQPILENATIHGVVKGGVSRVQISFYIINDRLYCSISDNGPGIDATVRNKISSGSRKSRGMELLQKKAATLNELYELGLIVSFEDLSNKKEVFNGTRVTVSFLIGHSMNSEARQAKINKITQMSIQPLLNKDLNETT